MPMTATALSRKPSLFTDLLAPVALAGRLFWRCWPQLLLITSVGAVARELLIEAAVETGLRNALLGMSVLSLVVLAKLVVIVMMFMVLRPHLPAVTALARKPGADAQPAQEKREGTLTLVAATLLPFFAYYAAWGFLGDTVREYSRMALARVPFGESANFLNLLTSDWLIGSIAACWILRFLFKNIHKRQSATIWPYLIVACDATWVFIGLYALGTWQDELLRWIGSGALFDSLPQFDGLQVQLVTPAYAAEQFVPIELRGRSLLDSLRSLFFYALLPLVWLVMTAIIYGYDVATKRPSSDVAGTPARWRKWLGDFVGHWISGYRSRYMPVLRCVGMALRAGLPTLVALIIGYRLIGWLGAWAWVGITRHIGSHDLTDWQLIFEPLVLLIGSPSDLNGGILLDPLRICLLAAVFERAVAATPANER